MAHMSLLRSRSDCWMKEVGGAGFRLEEIAKGESFVSVFVYHEKAVGY